MPYTPEMQSSIDIINDLLRGYDMEPLTHPGEIKDWGITGNETLAQLQEMVNDFVSEEHTARCEAKNAWRYEV